jgi:hypothetical protein
MMRTLSTWVSVALAGAALLAGCGGSKSKSGTTSTAATSVPQATATGATSSSAGVHTNSTATTSATATTGAGTNATSPSAGATGRFPRFKGNLAERTKQAVAFCKKRVREQQGPASSKAQLERLCEKAASTNPATIHEAARELCVAIVGSSGLTGAAREQALARCKGA